MDADCYIVISTYYPKLDNQIIIGRQPEVKKNLTFCHNDNNNDNINCYFVLFYFHFSYMYSGCVYNFSPMKIYILKILFIFAFFVSPINVLFEMFLQVQAFSVIEGWN